MTTEEAVLRKMGLDYQCPAPGCCGMAGSFGFEADKYEVSVAVGELELLPAVRKASPDTLIIANGFSCREQIAQCTDRQAFHLAEVIQMALQQGSIGNPGPYPEKEAVRRRERAVKSSMKRAGLGLAGALAGGALLWSLTRRQS